MKLESSLRKVRSERTVNLTFNKILFILLSKVDYYFKIKNSYADIINMFPSTGDMQDSIQFK
jgi:hypothetical protein